MTTYRVYEFPVVSMPNDMEMDMRFEISDENVVSIKLDGNVIAECDWDGNLKQTIEKMIGDMK